MSQFEKNKIYFEILKYEVMEQQMPDPAVGLPEGYVIVEDETGVSHEIDWNDAVWLQDNDMPLNNVIEKYSLI